MRLLFLYFYTFYSIRNFGTLSPFLVTYEHGWRELRGFFRAEARARHRRGCAPQTWGVELTLRGVRLAPVRRWGVDFFQSTTESQSMRPTRGVHSARAAD